MGVVMKVKGTGPAPLGGARGKVQGLSGAAGRRLWEKLSMIDSDGLLQCLFVRLSWPDEVVPADGVAAKECLHSFRRSLFGVFPAAWFFWVMEVVPRKSGKLEGELVPHYHLILNVGQSMSVEAAHMLLVSLWQRAIKLPTDSVSARDFNRPGVGVDVRATYGRPEGIGWYLSKYVSKAAGQVEGYSTGRMWGIYGRKNVPYAPGSQAKMDIATWIQLKRLFRGWLHHRGKSSRNYARFLARQKIGFGITIIGLPSSEGLRMLRHASELAEMSVVVVSLDGEIL